MHGRGVLFVSGGSCDSEWKNGVADGWGADCPRRGGWYEGLWRGGHWRRGAQHHRNGNDVWEGDWAWDDTAKEHRMHGWGVWRKRMTKGDDGRYTEAQPASRGFFDFFGEGARFVDTLKNAVVIQAAVKVVDVKAAVNAEAHGKPVNLEVGRSKKKSKSSSSSSNSGQNKGLKLGRGKVEAKADVKVVADVKADVKVNPKNATEWVTVYEGEWNNGQRHGKGTWRSLSGTIYCGEWDHNVMSGTGRMLIGENDPLNDPGGSYVGGMRDDKFYGEGERVWSNGDRYQGTWNDGKEHGNGTKKWARDGSSFTGKWVNGVPVNGTLEWPNGDKFTGTFTEEMSCAQQGENRIRYCGEGFLSLDGNNKLKGSLQGNNTFHGADGVTSHVMGSSSTQLELTHERDQLQEQLRDTKELQSKQKNGEEEECDGVNTAGSILGADKTTRSEALSELSTAFKVATKFRSQLKKAAPLLVSLEESVSGLNQFLQSATERNQSLEVHLTELATLRESLEKVEESDTKCKEILGQTLTGMSSDSDIQQCSRNISALIQKLLGTKPSLLSGCTNTEEVQERRRTPAVPSKDINNLMKTKPWLKTVELPPPPSSGTSEPFTSILRGIAIKASLIQGECSKFDNCRKLIEEHTLLRKECNSQATLGQDLGREIEELLATCQGTNEQYKSKYMLMRGLEGDEQFMAHPDVWSQLSVLLPRSLQSVVDVTLSKCASTRSINEQSQVPNPSTTAATTATTTKAQQPGCTSEMMTTGGIIGMTTTTPPTPESGVNSCSNTGMVMSNSMECIVCDERPRNIRFHPCGHGVCCSECASNVRKCPFCRSPIQQKQKLFL
ncbi:hypothetical protein Pelo_16094 [Pelomyxa schiedti]|nr:hypothetical protein Pelo_16094 [Pelomyxa schiedti]